MVGYTFFSLGRIMATPGALEVIGHADIISALERHARKDWGEVGHDDLNANEAALRTGARLLSAYTSTSGIAFWIITEADRSITTVLLPEEY